jgi:hypothetical protein
MYLSTIEIQKKLIFIVKHPDYSTYYNKNSQRPKFYMKYPIKPKKKYFFENSINFENLKIRHLEVFTPLSFFSKIPLYIQPSRSIFWFRTDLDLEENCCLKFALSLPISPIFIYCYNPEEEKKSGSRRKLFLKKTLGILRNKLWLNNIQLLIFVQNSIDLIRILVKKHKSTQLIYSLNTLVPLNFKKEKKLRNFFKKIGIDPVIFTIDPSSLKPFHYFENKGAAFFQRIFDKNFKSTKFSKENVGLDYCFWNELKDKQNFPILLKNSLSISSKVKNPSIKSLFIQKKNLQQNNTNEFNLEYVVSKKIFSEFNLGLKFFFRKIIKKISFFDILIEKIKMNSRLKKFIFMRKIFRKKFNSNNLKSLG